MTVAGYFYTAYASWCLYSALCKGWWGAFCVIEMVCTNDTAQYFVGKNFGRTRIFPQSPKKSLEGYIGGGFIAYLSLVLMCPTLSHSVMLLLILVGMLGDA